ncbi:MAG TPA: hypothetical protein VMT76_00695 [Puia sp.]|nr:hypothetical protein [Puia sp.]
MKIAQRLELIIIMTLLTKFSNAQLQAGDSLQAIREFVQLRQMYNHLPVELQIHVQNSSVPFSNAADTLKTDMDVYYDDRSFYLKAEGLEEIVNDSLMIMVNNPAKTVLLYHNNQDIISNMEKSVMAIMPDSSIDALAKKYASSISPDGKDKNRIELKSRMKVYGTAFPKESVVVSYRVSIHQPIEFSRTKTLLAPVDSISYHGLMKDPAFDGKLVSASTSAGNVFFIVKEVTTSFRFDKIDHDVKLPPVTGNERVTRQANGEYVMAKGFEDYTLTKEF